MRQIGAEAKLAASRLAIASTKEKQTALRSAATWLKKDAAIVLAANEKDMRAGEERKLSKAMLDRLKLDGGRIDGIVSALNAIAELTDPVGQTIAQWDRPNGLEIERVRTPLGVIGVIFESRPNVTADAGALCLMAGNAVILRGGSDSFYSSAAIHKCMVKGLAEAGLPETAIQVVPTVDLSLIHI